MRAFIGSLLLARLAGAEKQYWIDKVEVGAEKQHWMDKAQDSAEKQYWIDKAQDGAEKQHWMDKAQDGAEKQHWMDKAQDGAEKLHWMDKVELGAEKQSIVSKGKVESHEQFWREKPKTRNDVWDDDFVALSGKYGSLDVYSLRDSFLVYSGDVYSEFNSQEFYSVFTSQDVYSSAYSEDIYSSAYSQDIYSSGYSQGVYSKAYSQDVYSSAYSQDVYSSAYSQDVYSSAYSQNVYSKAYSQDVYSNAYSNNVYSGEGSGYLSYSDFSYSMPVYSNNLYSLGSFSAAFSEGVEYSNDVYSNQIYSNDVYSNEASGDLTSVTFSQAETSVSQETSYSQETSHGEFSGVAFSSDFSYSDEYSYYSAEYSTGTVQTPPKLLSAVFSNDGRYVYVGFDKDTDRAVSVYPKLVATPFQCSLLFTFPSNRESSCLWLSASTVLVTIRATSQYTYVGDRLELLPNKVKSKCNNLDDCSGYLFAKSSFVFVSSPSNAVAPKVIISTSQVVNSCANIVLDLTQSAGRGSAPWRQIHWSVTGVDGVELANYLNGVTTDTVVVTLPNSQISTGQYIFTLTLVNMFGKSGSVAASVTVSSSFYIPSVTLSGPSSLLRPSELRLIGAASIPQCNGEAPIVAGLTFNYDVHTGGILQSQLISSSLNKKLFTLAPYSLQVLTNYVVTLNVTTAFGTFATSSIQVNVGRSGLVADVNVGSVFTVATDQVVELNASKSMDLDFPTDKSSLAYSWSCSVGGVDCGIAFSSSSLASISGTQLTVGKVYDLSLTVSDILGVAVADTINFQAVAVVGSHFASIVFPNQLPKYNPADRVRLSSQVTSQVDGIKSQWSGVNSINEPLDLTSITKTSLSNTLSAGISFFDITLHNDALTAGLTYLFRLTLNYETSTAFSELSVPMNSPPSGGKLQVLPLIGSAFETVYELTATLWSDDATDLPLSYRFASYQLSPQEASLIRESNALSHTSAYLSQGLQSRNYSLNLMGFAIDIFGASAISETTVVVNPPSDEESAIGTAQFLLNHTVGDVDVARQVLNALLATFNAVDCSAAPDCGALHRSECRLTAGTCGSCVIDFPVGEYGDANSQCVGLPNVRRLSDESSLISLLADTSSKTCPQDCNSNGVCVFVDYYGAILSECLVTDVTCRAKCVCDDGFFTSDCSRDETGLINELNAKDIVCSELLSSMSGEDSTVQIVKYRAKTVVDTFVDQSVVSDAAFLDCSDALLSAIELYPLHAAHDESIASVVEGLSHILGRGKLIPLEVFNRVNDELSLISRTRQLSMAAGESPIAIYSENLRYTTGTFYIGSFTNETQWNLPHNDLESVTGFRVSSAQLVNLLATSGVGVTGTVVGLAMWEVLVDNGFGHPNSSAVHLETNVLFGNIDTSPVDIHVLVLVNHQSIEYNEQTPYVGTVHCYQSLDSLSYYVNISCGTDQPAVEFLCPGSEAFKAQYTCAHSRDYPQCSEWDGTQYVPNDGCEVLGFDDMSTICECSGDIPSRRLLVDESNFASQLSVQTQPLTFELLGTSNLPERHKNIVIFVAVIILLFLSAPLFSFLLFTQAPSDPDESRKIVTQQILTTAASLLNLEAHHSNVWFRFFDQVWKNHEYVSVLQWRTSSSHQTRSYHIRQAVMIFGYILNFMFIHSILAWSVYADDKSCEDHLSATTCTRDSSPLLVSNQCKWDAEESYCHLNNPMHSEKEVYILCAFTLMFVIPLNYVWSCAVESLMTQLAVIAPSRPPSMHRDSQFSYKNVYAASGSASDPVKTYFKTSRRLLKDGNVTESTLAEEFVYVVSEAQKVVRGEIPSSEWHKNYLKTQLSLNESGDQVCNIATIRPQQSLHNKIVVARAAAESIQTRALLITDEELRNILLIEEFLIECLPSSLQYYARKFFFNQVVVSDVVNDYGFWFLPIYGIGALIIILVVAFNWYGQVTTATWLKLVFINVAVDVLLFIPLRIFLNTIVMPATVLLQLKATHQRLRSQYHSILTQMHNDFLSSHLEWVQHANAVCRAVRLPGVSTTVTNSLLFVSDEHINSGNVSFFNFGESIPSKIANILCIPVSIIAISLACFFPAIVLDLFLNIFVGCISTLLILAFYSLSKPYYGLPYIIIAFIIILCFVRELLKQFLPPGETTDADPAVHDMLQRYLSPADESHISKPLELSVIRRAILDESTSGPEVTNKKSNIASEAAAVSSIVVGMGSAPTEADLSGGAAHIEVHVDGVDLGATKERVRIGPEEYAAVSAIVLALLQNKEESEEWVTMHQAIDHSKILTDVSDAKKQRKVVHKIIQRMIDTDRSVLIHKAASGEKTEDEILIRAGYAPSQSRATELTLSAAAAVEEGTAL